MNLIEVFLAGLAVLLGYRAARWFWRRRRARRGGR